MHKITAIMVSLLGIALLLGACSPVTRPTPTPNPTPTPTPAPTPPSAPSPTPPPSVTVRIGAGQLYTEYQSNEIAADLKYKDKILEVTGVVTEIGVSQTTGKPVLFLAESLDAPFMEGVTVHFILDQKDKLATLSKGDIVTVRGTCDGVVLVRGTKEFGVYGVRLNDSILVE